MRVFFLLALVGCANSGFADDDMMMTDADPSGDGGKPKIGPLYDGGSDSGGTDDGSMGSDGSASDAGADAKQNLLGPACTHGAGFVAWKFHYNGSTSKITDVYSLPDSSNWDVAPAYSTSFADSIHGGGIDIGGGNWLLIRFSVANMNQIKGATLSVYGRSYNVTTSGSFDGWSPIYGDVKSQTNSHSNAWPYQWVSVDYSANVKIGDPPGLTGIRLYAGPNSNDLVINTVELCIDGN
jgi:hypothetical protein